MNSLKKTFTRQRWLLVPQLLLATLLALSFALTTHQTSHAVALVPHTETEQCQDLGNWLEDWYATAHDGTKVGRIDLYYNTVLKRLIGYV